MLTCNKAGSRMVVDAANSNGPFQPVALLHIREAGGTPGQVVRAQSFCYKCVA
ncbi:hypothetical protein FD755_019048 [Muntiacus reevesi]|uniref:Uncharacterized protein n=2 Tax=Muntiacus TaxID=9885 RepID=A0A5N3X4J1_MUNRE|nr:hypothetical protein FD754_013162 [Muntiacus muntjak]KAB0369043.1 hypothetical protein FD755_019048 [Muntiacus reevesi]